MREFDQFLTDTERDTLRSFADNEVMREAVRKSILAELYQTGVNSGLSPLTNFAFSFSKDSPNEVIGAQTRAKYEGLLLLKNAFDKIIQYQTESPRPRVTTNPAI